MVSRGVSDHRGVVSGGGVIGGGVDSVSHHRGGVNSVTNMAQTVTQEGSGVNSVTYVTNAMGDTVTQDRGGHTVMTKQTSGGGASSGDKG